MYNHGPPGYDCPFCRLARGEETSRSGQADIVRRDEHVIAFMSVDWFVGNPGHVLVTPVAHHENLFDLPPELGSPIQAVVRRVAFAMKQAYRCDGITIVQNNEPDGGQDVWHYHVHVFPRFRDDGFRQRPWQEAPEADRRHYAALLCAYLG